ncbi:MAG: hypothetical protein BGO98_36250 [Myxococcales bacterium 68-20]|nr:MAG: hypothetical protein BGO98_36250 [Myxococcales bacterium 68-20]
MSARGEDGELHASALRFGLHDAQLLRFAVDEHDPRARLLRIPTERLGEGLANDPTRRLLQARPYALVRRTRTLRIDLVGLRSEWMMSAGTRWRRFAVVDTEASSASRPRT